MEKKKYYRCVPTKQRSYIIEELLLNGAHRNCFLSKEEAVRHFEMAEKIAIEKYNSIIDGINKLKESLGNFYFDYYMEGDTYGIYESGLFIAFEVNGYLFEFLQWD